MYIIIDEFGSIMYSHTEPTDFTESVRLRETDVIVLRIHEPGEIPQMYTPKEPDGEYSAEWETLEQLPEHRDL